MAKPLLKGKNGPLVAVVASVAVAAVVIGSAIAYWQGPEDKASGAAPLPGPSSTPPKTPLPTITPRPTQTPTQTPRPPSVPPKASTAPPPSSATTSTGPTTVELTVAKLPSGRAPQVPYQVGREVRGGAGQPKTIADDALQIGRLNTDVMAVVSTSTGSELQRISYEVRRTPGVSSLVFTADQSAAAYAAGTLSNRGDTLTKGGVVYAEGSSIRKLALPNSWEVAVLAYRGGKVYFRAGDTERGDRWLYEWSPGAAKATRLKTVNNPTTISDDGTVAASTNLLNDGGSCHTLNSVASGKQLWRTCEHQLRGFTPDSRTVIGTPSNGEGYCYASIAALDAVTGRTIREWKGCLHSAVAEDDQHLLIVAVVSGGGGDPGTKSTIIRCDIGTGQCERATPITTDLALTLSE